MVVKMPIDDQNKLAGPPICCFIDNTCLFHALKSRHNLRLDYRELVRVLAGDAPHVRFYYSEDGGSSVERHKRRKFYSFLEKQLGFLMIELPLRKRRAVNTPLLGLVSWLRELGKSDLEIAERLGESSHWVSDLVEGGYEEKGLDCEIVYDMLRLAQNGRHQRFVLVSGDEDFARTVKRLRKDFGLDVTVAFYSLECSHVLQDVASKFVDLTDIPQISRSCYNQPVGQEIPIEEDA